MALSIFRTALSALVIIMNQTNFHIGFSPRGASHARRTRLGKLRWGASRRSCRSSALHGNPYVWPGCSADFQMNDPAFASEASTVVPRS
ncbi:hypothetical protein PsYK624_007210 [Phanerochaete sordida]|uniref:Uncharacterized protein n=1 Tax=Phanerochaete sordida TaxID=48140 RepID=A0A9P3FYS0_9APHY|nr:hypothetical protein PsYK624_007210 [Phanerochaete sordida]